MFRTYFRAVVSIVAPALNVLGGSAVSLALACCLLAWPATDVRAAALTWSPAGGGAWDTTTLNWNGFSTAYSDPNLDSVTFSNAGGGTIVVQGGGVTPVSVNVSAGSGTYTFSGGAINGAGGLTKSGNGTLAIDATYTGLAYTGTTQIDGGVLQIGHNSGGGGPSNRSLGGTLVLNGGTLRFQHTGAGHFNPTLTFTSQIQVNAAGGTIDFNGGSNGFTNTLGPLSLAGTLNVTGNTGSPNNFGADYNFTNGTIALTADAGITNSTTTALNGPHTIVLSTTMTGSTRKLTLNRTGSGGGFQLGAAADYTAKSIDLKDIQSNANLNVSSTTGGADPFQLLQNNGGKLTMGTGTTLSMMGGVNSGVPQIVDPTAIAFSGNNTLFLYRAAGGNRDSYHRITDNLTVSGASGLTNLSYEAIRGTLSVDAGKAVTVGNGGQLTVNVVNTLNGFFSGNVNLHDGATVQGNISGTFLGGFVRGTTGTLTLGDGTGTGANADVVTFSGNSAGTTKTFNLGWAANTAESGVVRAKYANSDANNYYNVGWSNGGSPTAALLAFKETAGGTEFASLLGAGGVAVVGPTAGTIATFNNPVTLTTAGKVGFYNRANTNNDRGALGDVTFADSVAGIGTIEANVATVSGVLSPGLSAGTLTFNSDLLLTNSAELVFELNNPAIPSSSDTVVVNGDLTLDGTLTLLGGSLGNYTLFTYTGNLINNGLIIPDNASLDFSQPGLVLLSVVPEPSTFALVALAFTGFACSIRRKSRRAA